MSPTQRTRAPLGRSEARAQAFRGRRRGYYVLNPVTDLAVAGPYGNESEAQLEADRRNAIPPIVDKLIVRLIVPDHPGRSGYR